MQLNYNVHGVDTVSALGLSYFVFELHLFNENCSVLCSFFQISQVRVLLLVLDFEA